jgi:hypothetical protein
MAHTLTVLTLQLAQAIGLYALAAGIGLLLVPGRMTAILAEMESSPGLTYAFGVIAFALGIAILIPHHLLYDPLSCFVTGLAAAATAQGALILAAPRIFFALARPAAFPERLLAIVAIVGGAVLFLAGFTGRADALP